MKKRIFLALLLVAAAWVAGRFMMSEGEEGRGDYAGQSEIHQSFELAPGARVEVRGINGPVTVETSETTTAEVHVSRTAKDPGDIAEQKILIEHTPTSLVVRGERGSGRGWWRRLFGGGGRVETRVTLRLPRRVGFEARGINGAVNVGEIDGALSVKGVNGRVEARQAEGNARIAGTNGGVQLTFARVGGEGVEVAGVNGDVQFRMGAEASADVDVHGLNGKVSVTMPGATVERSDHGSRVRAKIGAGGAQVEVKGVNGDVSFDPAN